MEVILKQFVDKLGDKNDVVAVRDGYALNYLIPKGLAIPATSGAKRQRAEDIKQAEHRQARIRQEAEALAERIKAVTISLNTLVGKDGRMYGSITPLQLHNALKEQGVEVDRRRISLKDEVTTLGNYTAVITLHKEVKVEIAFAVVEKQG